MGWLAHRNGPLTVVLLVMAAASGAALASESTIEGFWRGEIHAPSERVEVMLDIRRDADDWTVLASIPLMSIRRVEMVDVRAGDDRLRFRIPTPGAPTFYARLSDDGRRLSGKFTRGAQGVPFDAARAEKPDDFDVDVYADYQGPGRPGEGLAGDWYGLIHATVHKTRLILHIEEDGQGRLVGVLDTPDQGVRGLEFEFFEYEDRSLGFIVDKIDASFEGTLDEDGSQLSGIWTQGKGQARVNFRRR